LIEEGTPITQNLDQSNSHSLEVITVLNIMVDEKGDTPSSSTSIFKNPKIGNKNTLVLREGCTTSILKHIGFKEEERKKKGLC
jgi:hypothetical protein